MFPLNRRFVASKTIRSILNQLFGSSEEETSDKSRTFTVLNKLEFI